MIIVRRKNFISVTIFLLMMTGCVSLQNAIEPEIIVSEKKIAAIERTEEPKELQTVDDTETEEEAELKGIIFAKTEFEGLLETRYVKFLFEDLDDPGHKFQIHIGEAPGQQNFPWEVKAVKPGYFFVELPAGRYRITSITIPVGTATASEPMNVTLEVVSNEVTYVGTLKMIGTKERIKLGGVPVIKPGFEYTISVLDQREEGAEAFKKNYPDFPHGVSVRLMEVHEAIQEYTGALEDE